MPSPRLSAAEMLRDILEKKLFLSDVRSVLDSFSSQDKAFANMLLLTALRHLVYLEKVLSTYVKKKLPAKAALVRYFLLLGITEILYLKTPDYAVINTYVDLTKKQADKYISGFVNAVLRRVCRDSANLIADDSGAFFPPAFRKMLASSYSPHQLDQIEKASLLEPPLDISVKDSPAAWAAKLNAERLPLDSLRLHDKSNISELDGYQQGAWWVQDFAASLAVKTLLPVGLKNLRVLDLCAAPGGKTAQLLSAGALVTSLDVSPERLQTLRQNLQRLQLSASEIICADALAYLQNFTAQPFDAVLLDAPCSATGTLRRHPEVVHLKTIADIKRQISLQRQILQHLKPAVKVGGFVVYCTCSLHHGEGEEQIKDFLAANPDFKLQELSSVLPDLPAEMFTREGFIRTLLCHLSAQGGVDGFFIARLQRIR